SVSGVPDSYILINDKNDGIAIDKACEIKPTWNAAVCKGDVGRLTVGGPGPGPGGGGGLRGFGGAPGAGPGRGAPAGPSPGAGLRLASVRSGPGAPAGRPGVPADRPSGPPQPPVTLSRNGKEVTLTGATNIRAGTEIKVTTERASLALSLSELDRGSWVIFDLPGFATAASGMPQDSLNALRKASATSYYRGKDSLWVKVVSNGEGARISGPGAGGTTVQVSR
ncbi:MAG: hypothetical protein ACRDNW_22950, partial [Trebonia sp.]